MSTSVIEYVLARLKAIGISHVFGAAGDYAFLEDAIVAFPGIAWDGCCRKLNAAYAADGYARIQRRALRRADLRDGVLLA